MAEFITAHSQRTIVLDVKVAADLKRGDLVTLNTSTNTIAKAVSLAAATHMIALSDDTVGGVSHVRTDLGNYVSADKVAASTTAVKKVGVYPVFDKEDIVLAADGSDLAGS